jgi:20S proteasome subunit beta 1
MTSLAMPYQSNTSTSVALVEPSLKPGEISTGTTIVAVPFQDGVVVGADSRVSSGTYVANRVSDKIVQLTKHIFACRSGSAADTQALTDYVKYYLQQWQLENHNRPPKVKTAAHLMAKMCYENKDNLLAGLLISGWDPVDGCSVYSIALGGACLKVPFGLSGSGSTYIYGLIDSEFRPDMTQDQARALVKKAIAHAMARDGSSGGVIRTVVITAEGNDRDYTPGNALPFGPTGY